MKIKCPFCNKELGNADYRATVHTNAYHDLRKKIHKKREQHAKFQTTYDVGIVQLLDYLLEDKN